MVQVPTVLKKVFETFPVVEYPSLPNSTPIIQQSIERNRFYFQRSPPSEKGAFTLGVFNLFKYQDNYIPTDPLSLAVTLHLCSKHGLKLPNCQGDSGDSGHSIMKMSYFGSPNSFLPILIEDGTSREIHLASALISGICKSDDVKETLLSDLLDVELYDLWLLSVWFEYEKLDLTALFGIEIVSLTKYELFESILTWRDFKVRYPILNRSIYDAKLSHVEELLSLLSEDLNNLSRGHLIKVYAYVIIVENLMKSTEARKVIPSKLSLNASNYMNGM
ncbi:hypothetical protein PSN45_001791 [Yamadazyma tenuis]|uniref:uncharacterized protein n=1 Tax=Candida tenuis TaxID=2315449 RepID=UPI00279B5E9C|nr:hypothetical protein PSN45_001791 [Yamadazyma tenuis]